MTASHIIRKESLDHVEWSGGVTTQLAIYPDDASYADRNFLWRVSTATVEVERSDFTLLPEVSRILMVLEGSLRLVYNGSCEVILSRFGQDSFSGDWNTESFGRVRDFNLMMKEGCTGSVEALELISNTLPRLYTAEGVVHSGSFTDTGRSCVAGSKISEVYYALTDVILNADEEEAVRLNAGDVYIRSRNAFEIPAKLTVSRNLDGSTIIIRALISHI